MFRNQVVLNETREATIAGKISTSEEEKYMASLSANLKSVNTVVSDISMATRFQIEWPRAINAFKKTHYLGLDPHLSLKQQTVIIFAGWANGLLGTIAFLNILFLILKTIWDSIKKLSFDERLIGYGFIFGFLALFINASYIDAFEASKLPILFGQLRDYILGTIH